MQSACRPGPNHSGRFEARSGRSATNAPRQTWLPVTAEKGTDVRAARYATPATLALASLLSANALAAETSAHLLLPSASLDRTGSVPVVFKFNHAHTGHGELKVRWTDSLGRVVEQFEQPVTLTDEISFTFSIDLARAAAMSNTLESSLSLEETTSKGIAHVEETAEAKFIAKPNGGPWNDYVIIMYQQYPQAIQSRLGEIGIDAGQYPGNDPGVPEFLVQSNRRWYSEQIGTDFYAEYHRYRTDRGVDWSFEHARELYDKDPTSKEAFKRHPSFYDPVWRNRIHDRLVEVAQRNAPYRPLFYSLSDESGIANLGAQWDFDFSDESLVPMRRWLVQRYGTLDALNAEWASSFTDWNLVTPLTTNEAMARKDENYTAWADFKEWMDLSYINALQMGVDAVHEVDGQAYVGIVGAQKPGWGGYDYSRLARVNSVMEPYDIGGSVKLTHTLNTSIPLLTTSFASSAWERHRVWYELLQGERGLILWDEAQQYIRPDGSEGNAGKLAKSYYQELRDGMGALLINSTSIGGDRIAVHYSQPSLRTEWMLERKPDGVAWMKRNASYERIHNDFMRLRESWGHAIEDQGLEYNFVSYLQIEEGELLKRGYRVLILPRSSSLSKAEADNIRSFVAAGGTVVADGVPGTFNEHSRRLPKPLLADLFGDPETGPLTIHRFGAGKAISVHAATLAYLQDRLNGKEGPTYQVMADLFRECGIHPTFAVTDAKIKPVVGVNVHVFANGSTRLLAMQSNPQQSVDELGPADFHSNKRFEEPRRLSIHLPSPMYVYDTRAKKDLGRQTRLEVNLDPYDPTILSLSPEPQPKMQVVIENRAAAGDLVSLALATPDAPSATQVYHVDVVDPGGKRSLLYSGNVIAPADAALKQIPFARNDALGTWTVRVQNMLSGEVQTRSLDLYDPPSAGAAQK